MFASATTRAQSPGCQAIHPVPTEWLTDEVKARLREAHPFHGFAQPGDPPRLFFKLEQKPEPPLFWAQGSPGVFGAALVITALQRKKGNAASLCIHSDTDLFAAMRAGRFVAAFVYRNQITAAFDVQLDERDGFAFAQEWGDIAELIRQRFGGSMSFCDQWQHITEQVPIFRNRHACKWGTIEALKHTTSSLTPEDKLSIGWVRRLALAVRLLQSAIERASTMPLAHPEHQPPASISAFVELINSPELSIASLIDFITAKHREGRDSFRDLLAAQVEYQAFCHQATGHTHCMLDQLTVELYCLLPDITDQGRRVAWISLHDHSVNHLSLRPAEFPSAFDPSDYWRRLSTTLPYALGELISADESPVDLTLDSPLWRSFAVCESAAETEATADILIEEAIASRKWSIPNGAIFELSVGPFSHFETYEIKDDICFIGRTRRSEFALIFLGLRDRRLHFKALDSARSEEHPDEIRATLKLLFAALVRDFWVVEHREQVFASRTARSPMRNRGPNPGPITVYIPRIKYSGNANLERCESQLAQTSRRAHYVDAHLRRAAHASEHQLILAQRHGFDIPEGYTFVRPHERGHDSRDIVYRSRSALQSLHDATNDWSKRAEVPEWFTFERDVLQLLDHFGLVVEHLAASSEGDLGVDVYATHKNERQGGPWLIHCKAYAPKDKVRPAVLRRLIAAQSRYPSGTRGMVITTSMFTSACRPLAAEHGIRLIDGIELGRLLTTT